MLVNGPQLSYVMVTNRHVSHINYAVKRACGWIRRNNLVSFEYNQIMIKLSRGKRAMFNYIEEQLNKDTLGFVHTTKET